MRSPGVGMVVELMAPVEPGSQEEEEGQVATDLPLEALMPTFAVTFATRWQLLDRSEGRQDRSW